MEGAYGHESESSMKELHRALHSVGERDLLQLRSDLDELRRDVAGNVTDASDDHKRIVVLEARCIDQDGNLDRLGAGIRNETERRTTANQNIRKEFDRLIARIARLEAAVENLERLPASITDRLTGLEFAVKAIESWAGQDFDDLPFADGNVVDGGPASPEEIAEMDRYVAEDAAERQAMDATPATITVGTVIGSLLAIDRTNLPSEADARKAAAHTESHIFDDCRGTLARIVEAVYGK